MMNYYNSKSLQISFESAVEKVTEELKKEGFGVLTQIDIRETLKKKLDVDFRKYLILGACNPPFAYKALSTEANIGILLPCNVVVQEISEGETMVSVVNPLNSMQSVNNAALQEVATPVAEKLERVLHAL